MPYKIIPRYDDYDLIGRTCLDATIALANSDGTLISREVVKGVSVVHKFGAALDVGTDMVPITTSKTWNTPTDPTSLELVSGDITDNGASSPLGSGAHTVRVIGLSDWAGNEATEDVVLDGTTPVALSMSLLRVYRMKVMTSGSYATQAQGSHNGVITLRETGAGAIWATIVDVSGFLAGQTEISVYTIPAGKVGFVPSFSVWVQSNKPANVVLFAREGANIITLPYSAMQAKVVLRNINDHVALQPKTPFGPFVGPCDIGWMGAATSVPSSIEVDYEILLFDA